MRGVPVSMDNNGLHYNLDSGEFEIISSPPKWKEEDIYNIKDLAKRIEKDFDLKYFILEASVKNGEIFILQVKS